MRSLLFVGLLLPLLLGLSSCEEDTPPVERDTIELAGTMEQSMTIPVNTDVLVSDNLTIPSGIELVVEQGVHFQVSDGKAIILTGRLKINGTILNPVLFMPAVDGELWYGLTTTSNDTIFSLDLNNAHFTDCLQGISIHGINASLTGVKVSNCLTYGIICSNDNGTTITDLEVFDCEVGVSLESGSNALVTDAWLHDNEIGFWSTSTRAVLRASIIENNTNTGVRSDTYGDSLQILDNTITENQTGVMFRYGPEVVLLGNTISLNIRGILLVSYQRSSLVLHENNLLENEQFAISYESDINPDFTVPLDISNNYWGTTDSAAIAEMVIDAYDNPGWDTLRFVPFAMIPF
ncbi:MAG: right-handed parallel beta-helix repeat-containing protein [Candidatus Delongbacteria bacterium]|nr:right-handed parallel beta-helix repeat-containing protein [Candidatus Delongbacteria bacterium]